MIEGFFRGLSQPEYLHTLLNPLPVYGLGLALLGLILGLIFRSRPAQILSLLLILVSAASAWPAAHYGEKAFDQILTLADDDGRLWLQEHADGAEKVLYFFNALAVLSALAIILPRKWPRTAQPLTIATVALALVSLGVGASIAYAGGKIRHREFRTVAPPTKSPERDSG